MRLRRFSASMLVVQGILPVVLFGVWRPGGWALLLLAGVYAGVGLGLWGARRGALLMAFVLTAFQFVTVSSPLVSWRLLLGVSAGFGFTSAPSFLQSQVLLYHSFGGRADFACFGRSPAIATDFANGFSKSFILFNVLVLPMWMLLAAVWITRAKGRPPTLPGNA